MSYCAIPTVDPLPSQDCVSLSPRRDDVVSQGIALSRRAELLAKPIHAGIVASRVRHIFPQTTNSRTARVRFRGRRIGIGRGGGDGHDDRGIPPEEDRQGGMKIRFAFVFMGSCARRGA